GAEDGEEKAVCIGLPHKDHTVPVVSVRLRVALYFVNIFTQGNKSFCSASPHNRTIFIQWQTLAIFW
ncbi:ABC transporter permease, partial [Klebsiella pneumoniae]|uniref:ABC transporter permease n=1 Tax=Klebsiella pneumoniae TaxID=573 RepID=UPI0030188A2B